MLSLSLGVLQEFTGVNYLSGVALNCAKRAGKLCLDRGSVGSRVSKTLSLIP